MEDSSCSKHSYRTLSEKLYGKDRVRIKEQIEQIEKEQENVRKRMTELRSKLPAESESHGWIWLFLRKETETPFCKKMTKWEPKRLLNRN